MKPIKRYTSRHPSRVQMRELEAGDFPFDSEGRALPFVPGDMLVLSPFQNYVLGRELAETLYVEEDQNGDAEHERR